MRDPARIKVILNKLEELWLKVPDQRFGQVLENYVFGCQKQLRMPKEVVPFDPNNMQLYYPKIVGECIFHIEDDDVDNMLKIVLRRFD